MLSRKTFNLQTTITNKSNPNDNKTKEKEQLYYNNKQTTTHC